ncbi:MAG: histone deacetylase family protein [Rhodospirillales bacterium]
MTTGLYTHPVCIEHDTGRHHPERPDRLRYVLDGLDDPAFAALDRREAPLATREQIALAHPMVHVDEVLGAVPATGLAMLDGDTVVSPKSGEAALRAAGAVIAAVDSVMAGEMTNAFCATRPPGHHAEAAQSMGFCLFNNVVIAAHHARVAYGLRRIAVMDFDVHHGNGTQHLFEADRGLFYASTHQMPLYPGTGAVAERGVGNIVNAPLRPGAGSEEFRAAMTGIVLPAIRSFDPEFLIISAGFDAHRDDPLGGLNLDEADYAWATAELCAIAADCCERRVVSTLEGGYDLGALRDSAAAHVLALMTA